MASEPYVPISLASIYAEQRETARTTSEHGVLLKEMREDHRELRDEVVKIRERIAKVPTLSGVAALGGIVAGASTVIQLLH